MQKPDLNELDQYQKTNKNNKLRNLLKSLNIVLNVIITKTVWENSLGVFSKKYSKKSY